MNGDEVSLYFHIPFCSKKCHYCHFYVVPDHESNKEMLLEAFKLEWSRWLPQLKQKKIATVYFGGGTPSLFGPQRIAALLELISKDLTYASSYPEITLEANPEDITPELMSAYKQAGINRVSIGIQTLDDALLKSLGRLHNASKAIRAVHQTYEAGFDNISVDLMYDLPQQTLTHWDNTLHEIRQLPISHLSLYNLTIEPHTLFFKNRNILSKQLPDEETSLKMYERAVELLEDACLRQYEISAFAKEGFEAQHNRGYWTGRPFLGFGPSAFSYWEGKRFRNVAHLKKYSEALVNGQSPIDFEEELIPTARIRELFVIQLRLISGINLDVFQSNHGFLDDEIKEILDKLAAEGLLQIQTNKVSLTRRGILFYDTVASELI